MRVGGSRSKPLLAVAPLRLPTKVSAGSKEPSPDDTPLFEQGIAILGTSVSGILL